MRKSHHIYPHCNIPAKQNSHPLLLPRMQLALQRKLHKFPPVKNEAKKLISTFDILVCRVIKKCTATVTVGFTFFVLILHDNFLN